MSRIESGHMTIKQEEFSFSRGLEQINTMISGQCSEKGLTYDCRINGRIDEYYVGDVMKLKQVLINILGNAVKFTPAGGEVVFLIEEGPRLNQKATLKFVISDTGIGMSKEYLPHLFEAFSQEDSSSTSRYGSTGLGMPITKSIVELVNGHIEVESEKGKGSVFTVTVTLGESDRQSIPAEEGEFSLHDMSVLVIDDDPIALEHAEIVLGQIGIGTDTAGSGWEGIDKVRIRHARREDFDLILIDWRMPEMDGLETTRQFRSIVGGDTPIIILTSFNWDDIADDAKKVPIIALTANAFDEDVQRSMQAGLNAHLSKPVEPDALFETLEKLIL